jgi:hypothetical protein
MKNPLRAAIIAAATIPLLAGAASFPAMGQSKMTVSLFKVVTVKDEVMIGLNAAELKALGAQDKAPAGAIAAALAGKKPLTVWQYAVRKADSGDLQVAPLHQIGLLPHDSLRVEPYSSPLTVLPHD